MWIAIAIIPLMALAITFDVILRYVFNAPTIWVFDVSGYAMLWLAFLSAPWLVRHHGHIRIEFVTMRLGPRARPRLSVLTSLIGAVTMAVVTWQTASETITAFVSGYLTVGSFQIPRWLVWVVMPVGSLFTVLEFLRAAWLSLSSLRGDGDPASALPELPYAMDPTESMGSV